MPHNRVGYEAQAGSVMYPTRLSCILPTRPALRLGAHSALAGKPKFSTSSRDVSCGQSVALTGWRRQGSEKQR